jgi:hypothetical protein
MAIYLIFHLIFSSIHPFREAVMKHTHLFRRLWAGSEGNVFMIVAGGMAVIIAVSGVAIDLGRQQLIHAKLQQATDAAGLAYQSLAVPPGTDATTDKQERTDAANRYFALNFPATYMGVNRPEVTVSPDTTTVRISTAPINVPMLFIKLIPLAPNYLTTAASTTVTGSPATPQAYDLVLAMDNSGSMGTTDAGAGGTLAVTDVGTVHALAANACANSLVNEGYSTYPTFTRDYLFTHNCDNAQDGGASESIINDQSTTISYFGITNGSGNTRLNALRFAADTIASKLLSSNTVGSQVGIVQWSDQIVSSVPFQTDYGTVHNTLMNMYAYGGTNSKYALQEVQNNFLPNFNAAHVHAVVLLTDGYNTSVGNLQTVWNPSATQFVPNPPNDGFCNGLDYCSQTNDQSLPLCDALKSSGVQIYTIAFGTDVTGGTQAAAAQAFLSACATQDVPGSGTKHFFVAPDADMLNAAFTSILTGLKQIRISK